MNVLDVVLLVVVLGQAVSGYWQGFLVGASATVGLLLGGLAGIVAAPAVLGGLDSPVAAGVAAVVGVLVLASVGQLAGAYLGALLRRTLTWSPARALDALGGALLSAGAVLVIAWLVGWAMSGARVPWLGDQVRGSQVLSAVDAVLPDATAGIVGGLDDLVDSDRFPRYLRPFVPERITPVAPPARGVLADPQVRSASGGVVKVLGQAPSCDRGLEGSGFAYAPERVMTNAHVLAGVTDVVVESVGEQLPAEVVLFDADLDVAVLAVDGLDVAPLRFVADGGPGDPSAVLGFPENGPYDARPARIRDEQQVASLDIYGEPAASREVFSVRAEVLPGNSGGPLVSEAGQVYGVVFAASVSDGSTAYALTAAQVAAPAARGRGAAEPVATGPCA